MRREPPTLSTTDIEIATLTQLLADTDRAIHALFGHIQHCKDSFQYLLPYVNSYLTQIDALSDAIRSMKDLRESHCGESANLPPAAVTHSANPALNVRRKPRRKGRKKNER